MVLVQCDDVTEGLRPSEVTAVIRDYDGRRHYIRVERDFLTHINGSEYLPMGLIHVDPKTKAFLLEFSHEPDSGINRIWVEKEKVDQLGGAYV